MQVSYTFWKEPEGTECLIPPGISENPSCNRQSLIFFFFHFHSEITVENGYKGRAGIGQIETKVPLSTTFKTAGDQFWPQQPCTMVGEVLSVSGPQLSHWGSDDLNSMAAAYISEEEGHAKLSSKNVSGWRAMQPWKVRKNMLASFFVSSSPSTK